MESMSETISAGKNLTNIDFISVNIGYCRHGNLPDYNNYNILPEYPKET